MCNPGHRQLRAAAVRAFENGELGAARALSQIGRAQRSFVRSGKNHVCAWVRFAIISAERIVRIQDQCPIRAERFGERAFFLRDRFARSHEFDVRDTDVRDDADIGRGDLGERSNLSRMIHSQFPKRRFHASTSLRTLCAEDQRDC